MALIRHHPQLPVLRPMIDPRHHHRMKRILLNQAGQLNQQPKIDLQRHSAILGVDHIQHDFEGDFIVPFQLDHLCECGSTVAEERGKDAGGFGNHLGCDKELGLPEL